MPSKDVAAIRDQLGNDPTIFPVLVSEYFEQLGLEGGPCIFNEVNIAHGFILGHPTNGVLGVANGVDGEQLELGGSSRTTVVNSIINPGKIFHEHFRDTDFADTTQTNTANWDTTNFRLAQSTSVAHLPAVTTYHLGPIAKNDGTEGVTAVQVSATETKWGSDEIEYWVRTTSTGTWEEITFNTKTTLQVAGDELYLRIIFKGQGGADTYIEDLRVDYS